MDPLRAVSERKTPLPSPLACPLACNYAERSGVAAMWLRPTTVALTAEQLTALHVIAGFYQHTGGGHVSGARKAYLTG